MKSIKHLLYSFVCILCFTKQILAEQILASLDDSATISYLDDTTESSFDDEKKSFFEWLGSGAVFVQLVNLHVGYSGNGLDSGMAHSANVGVSVGLNYDERYIAGLRLRYLYEGGAFSQHVIGVVSYWHYPKRVSTLLAPPSLVLGAGYIANAHYKNGIGVNGGYVEVGLALQKLLPLTNVDLLYRASFYESSAPFAEGVIHGVHVVFALF